jgi:transposase
MESTGDYWKRVYNILEDSFEVCVVNAKHVKHVPGRKTDVKDAEWLAELMMHGLLKASFVPNKAQRALRDLTRYRSKLVEERSRIVNRVQKLLEGANIKLSSVVSDVMGKSARAMLAEIVAVQTDTGLMADLARGRMRSKIAELEKALTGLVSEHHRFLLAKQLAHIDFLDEQIADIGAEIARHIETTPPYSSSSDKDDTTESESTSTEQDESALTWEEAVALWTLCRA